MQAAADIGTAWRESPKARKAKEYRAMKHLSFHNTFFQR